MSGQQNSFTPTPRVKTPLDLKHLKLYAKNEDGKNAALSVGLFSNNPRFTVFTNVEADKNVEYGKINAPMNVVSFRAAMNLVKMAIDFQPTESTPEFKVKMDLLGTGWSGRQPLPDPVLQAHFWAGKDKTGCVWVSVAAPDHKNRPRLKFIICPDEWTAFQHGTGEQWSRGEASVHWAKSWYDSMIDLVAHMQVSHYVLPPPPKNQQGGGGYNNGGNQGGGQGGGYNNNNNGGGNQGGGRGAPPPRQMSDDSEDIPF